MRNIIQAMLTFLLNGVWQIAAVALFSVLANQLLRSVMRYRHVIWVTALALSLVLPLLSSGALHVFETSPAVSSRNTINEPTAIAPSRLSDASEPAVQSVSSGFHLSGRLAILLLAIYLLIVGYRSAKLMSAAIKTRAVKRGALQFEPEGNLRNIVERCQTEFGVRKVRFFKSASIPAAATLGFFNPVVILPAELLEAGDDNALAAAVGHELVHIARHDYLLNLIYELVFLPLSFHPAAALIKRRITQTRELRCDELVSERLLHPEVYARSLVRLAGLAMPFTRRAQTMIVGVADADILEVRIMSLLKGNKSNLRRTVLGLMLAAVLLAVPCVAAATLVLRFNIDSPLAQEPSRERQEKREVDARKEREFKERWEKETTELRQRVERETNAEIKAKLEKELQDREKEKVTAVYTLERGGYAVSFQRDEEGARQERALEEKRNTELARAARISMDQAIQIATSKMPGKVLQCSLVGEHWEAPGKLAKDGQVLYHVVILSGDEPSQVKSHVLINAIDGSVFRTETEKRRSSENEMSERLPYNDTQDRMLTKKSIEGGVLNGKAASLPLPRYPEIARVARAAGAVQVRITIDESGSVVEANAISGHPLLRAAAVTAAREAKFMQTRLQGEPVPVSGILVYNFTIQ